MVPQVLWIVGDVTELLAAASLRLAPATVGPGTQPNNLLYSVASYENTQIRKDTNVKWLKDPTTRAVSLSLIPLKGFWIWIGSWRCRDSRVSQNDHSPEATAAQPSTCHMLLPPVSQCTLGTVGSANTQPAAQSNYPNVYYSYHLCYNHTWHRVKYKTVQWVQFTGFISSSEVFICMYHWYIGPVQKSRK